ncbi:MAG: AtpZ/AtpI family protein [Candidatus Omnitrophota bacterium]
MTPKIDKSNFQHVSIGLNVATGMFVFSYLGFLADKKWGGQAWTLVGILLGLVYSAYEIWKLIRQLNDQDKKT